MEIIKHQEPANNRLYFFNMKKFSFIAALFLALLASSCSDDETPKRVVLVEATSFLTRNADELRFYLENFPVDLDINSNAVQYDVEIFQKIE